MHASWEEAMRDGKRILDADAHVVEPGDVFGDLQRIGPELMDLPPTTPFQAAGDSAKLTDFFEAGCSADAYLRCMDVEDIDAVVLYPSMGLYVPYLPELDAKASAAACRAYSDWIAGYCATNPSRLAGVGILPLADVQLAVHEARHAAELGLPGVMARPNHVYGRSLGARDYDPLYDLLEETGLVLAVHEGLGVRGAPTIGRDVSETFAVRHAMSHPMEQMAAMASLMLEGALERHPRLRVAFLESGTGWLPYWLARLDGHAEWMRDTETGGLSLTPSEYFARQCMISTDPDDPLAAWTVSQVGADHVVWASDFPHPDALYPEAVTSFFKESAEHGLDGGDLDAVLWDTPVRFYRLGDRFDTA
jgi:predicted TIM-barrel fold metal-dependent hydrolase